MENPAKKLETDSAPKNTATLIAGFITELVANEDAIDRETEKHIQPLTQHRKDLLKAAKSNMLNVKAIKNAVKFKRAEAAARRAIADDIGETEVYLSYIQIEMFPAAA